MFNQTLEIMKQIWIIANWKSNKTIREALEWIDQVGPQLPRRGDLKVVVCPSFVDIEEVKKAVMVGNYPMIIGCQDLSPFGEGPYTGEETARTLADLVEVAILGHSERREHFGETDQIVAEKAKQARKFNIKPLVCVQNENTSIPQGVTLVAYEPVFAIGSGHPDAPAHANQVAEQLRQKYGRALNVLYGGSVSAANAGIFLQQPHLAGLLVGEASLDQLEFLKIVKMAESG